MVSAVDADMAVCAVPCFVLVGIMMVGWFLTVVHPFAVRTVIPWLVGQIVGVQRDAKTLFDFVVRIAEQVVLACFDASIAAFREQCLGVGVRGASAMFLQKRLDLSPRVGDGADYLIVGMLDAVVHGALLVMVSVPGLFLLDRLVKRSVTGQRGSSHKTGANPQGARQR